MTQGLQWVLLAEEEIAPTIVAMDGRRSRVKPEHQVAALGDGHSQDVNNAKLLRKLEAQGGSVKGVLIVRWIIK